MDAEVLVWTIVFVGGDLAIVIFLLLWAVKKDRQKARTTDDAEEAAAS